jgi:succinyl-diaminopimelate desuccinylase
VMNAVCDSLLVTLLPDKRLADYLKKNGVDCDVNLDEQMMSVHFRGKTAHGSTPELGVSAVTSACRALGDFYNIPTLKNIADALKETNGKSFGGYNHSEELGDTTYNFGLIDYDGNKKVLKLSIDFRYGESAKPDALIDNFGKKTQLICTKISEAKPLLFDKKSPLVATLMKAYRLETLRLFDKPLAIGGGTYAKEAKNTVAFGAAFKEHPGNMHSPDEYIYLEDFYKDIAIYARAIYLLGHTK